MPESAKLQCYIVVTNGFWLSVNNLPAQVSMGCVYVVLLNMLVTQNKILLWTRISETAVLKL